MQPALDFLNSGGTPAAVVDAFVQKYGARIPTPALQQDVTGDGVNELILTNDLSVLVLGCNAGEYQALLNETGGDPASSIRFVRFTIPGDMNLNGIPEMITNVQAGHMSGFHNVSIFEWDGDQFASIIQGERDGDVSETAFMLGVTSISVRDVDGNKTLELILEGGVPYEESSDYTVGLPWRKETHSYSWNGNLFVLYRVEFSPPEYRFQAIQDGDRASLAGDYDQALALYQEAVFSDQLEWWSDERWSYEVRLRSLIETSDPTPVPDLTEYHHLAAYGRYRILLLHTVRGFLPEAETLFNTLTETFLPGQPGYAYVELAAAFWNEYRASANMGQACAAAIEYAALHPVEVLFYLGNGEYTDDIFGSQSLEYRPEDVCPFQSIPSSP